MKTVHFAKKQTDGCQLVVYPAYEINGFCLQEYILVASTMLR